MGYFSDLSDSQRHAYLDAHAFFSDSGSEKSFTGIISSIASLQSWLEYFVSARFNASVSAFFTEAVNDAILSYSFARVGTWRPALQSLRSTLENCLFFLYYKDHSVELALWSRQKHRIGFTELCHYLRAHPDLSDRNHQSETGIEHLEKAYSQLSQAVHGSVDHFRMVVKTSSSHELPAIHVKSPVELSRYRTMLRQLVEALNQLLVAVFREHLQGAALPALRQAIAAAVSAKKKALAKNVYNVVLH